MGVTFGTPVMNPMSARSSFTLAMSSVTSGQPIFVFYYAWQASGITSLTDDFSTPYTWVQVDSKSAGGTCIDLWIGTGGVGTSGTLTVSATNNTMGGIGVACVGASTAAGLAAVDSHNNNTGTGFTASSPTLTPGAADQGAVYGWSHSASNTVSDPSSPWVSTGLTVGATKTAGISTYASPPASPLTATWTSLASGNWRTVGAIVKAAAAPATGRVYKRFAGPLQLAGAAADLYTCPASTKARVLGIHASNPTGSPVTMYISIGADASGTRVYEYSVAAASILSPTFDPYDLAAGEKIQGFASSAGAVVLTISGWEQPA